MRTIQAVRQAVYSRLTVPPISYQINNGPTLTVPVANVQQRSIWQTAVGGKPLAPTPYIAFAVGGVAHQKLIAEMKLDLKLWVTVSSNDAECTEIYQAVRSLLHGADEESEPEFLVFPPPTLSRSATSTTLPLVVRRCRETRALPADFEPNSARWYVSAHYEIHAV